MTHVNSGSFFGAFDSGNARMNHNSFSKIISVVPFSERTMKDMGYIPLYSLFTFDLSI